MRLLIASLLLASATASVAAQSVSDFTVQRVTYADLDLSGTAGKAVLHHRLTTAVRAVCEILDTGAAVDQIVAKNCRREAMAGAERQLKVVLASVGLHHTADGTVLASR